MDLNKRLRLYVILILCFFGLSPSFSQEMQVYDLNYKATYLMTFRRDSLSKLETQQQVYLSFNDSLSIFRSEERYRRDSLRYQLLFGKVRPSGGIISRFGQSKEDNMIIKDGDKITTFENLSIVKENDVNFYHEEFKTDQNWQILNDTLTIHGFFCQKATLIYGNRIWAAWFTHEIPISDGPYRFAGLPGLIIRVEDHSNSWRFDLESLVKFSHKIVVNFDQSIQYKKIDKQKFYEQKKYLLDNIVSLRMSSTVSDDVELRIQNLKKTVADVRKKDNNWIELYP